MAERQKENRSRPETMNYLFPRNMRLVFNEEKLLLSTQLTPRSVLVISC